MKYLFKIGEFIFDPLNMLILLFLWVGIALACVDDVGLNVKMFCLNLMALPAYLGYRIGRRRK